MCFLKASYDSVNQLILSVAIIRIWIFYSVHIPFKTSDILEMYYIECMTGYIF